MLSTGSRSQLLPLASGLPSPPVGGPDPAISDRRRPPRWAWVLPLWEAFLLQMDEFDRLLEFQLRRKLDPLVATPAPARRDRVNRLKVGRRDEVGKKTKGVVSIDLRPDALVLLEHF